VILSENVVEASGLDAEFDRDGDELTQNWIVISDDVNDGPQFIYLNGTLFPKKNYLWSYGNDVGGVVRCTSVKITREAIVKIPGQVNLGAKWVVSCRFSTPEDEGAENPLNQPIKVSWQSVNREEPFVRDVETENVVCNSAGQLFPEPAMRENLTWVMVVQKNEATFDASYAESYANHVNSTTWQGGEPGTWKAGDVRAERLKDEVYGYYWQISVAFAFDPIGWNRPILDQGRYELVDDTTYGALLLEVLGANGVPVADPVPLNGAGQRLTSAQVEAGLRFWLPFKRYKEADFNSLFAF